MEYYAIQGGAPLSGSVRVHGAKNSALPILAATLLADGESVIHNCPDLTDITVAMDILSSLGCRVRREGRTVTVDTTGRQGCEVPDVLTEQMRASVLFLGALLARDGEAVACWPGGCELGSRPIDLHLSAFQALGAEIRDEDGRLVCRGAPLTGRKIRLKLPSVGATENIMLAACGAEGTTEILNAAREPEIQDLQAFLRALGADVVGAGTERIIIRGVVREGKKLHPGEHTVMPDRIVAATYLCAVAAAGGEGEFLEADASTLDPVLQALSAAGCALGSESGRIWIRSHGPLRGIGRLRTGPYPDFPTDAQPLLAAALAGGVGETDIVETIFDGRFRYTGALQTLGADIRVAGDTAHITGTPLRGARVEAADLRGGAALTIAALAAEGESEIRGLSYLDRGYASMEADLQALGGGIWRRSV